MRNNQLTHCVHTGGIAEDLKEENRNGHLCPWNCVYRRNGISMQAKDKGRYVRNM